MKVSTTWIKELVNLNIPMEEVEKLLPLRTIALKEVTPDYFELDMKGYNRSDLLSLWGVAYELKAITGSKVSFNESELTDILLFWQNLPSTKIEVKDFALCPIYCIAKIEGLNVKKTPEEWTKKLESSGMRAVNNVADVTNLIMVEYGQPMHAFDADKVKDETLIVRTARDNEEITTLDGKVRKLVSSDLVIADPEKVVGIAGIMGGKNSEITDSTSSILLEAAIFDPQNLRKTVQRLNLPSEASKRFIHGLTAKRLIQALQAAIKMYEDIGGKLTGITVVGNISSDFKTIPLSLDNLNNLVGIDISREFVNNSLKALNFEVKEIDENSWKVIPPYFRLDITIEADIIEEVARMWGYEKIPPKPLPEEKLSHIDQSRYQFLNELRNRLVTHGLSEIQTYPYFSTQVLNNLNIDKAKLIKIANPMSKETEYMRVYLWPNLLESIANNIRKNNLDNIGIFEIGKVYNIENESPVERTVLSIALAGKTGEVSQELVSILVKLFQELCLDVEVKQETLEKTNLFNPQAYAKIIQESQEKGYLGEVHPRIVNKFGIEKRVAILEMDLSSLK